MKKINRHGFTLIELLAVIVILGILMMVAIPAMTRYIENSRKDTFGDTAKSYISAVRYAYLNDELVENADPSVSCTGLNNVYVQINTNTKTTGYDAEKDNVLLESGGKSSWAQKDLYGYVLINLDAKGNATYSIALTDLTHGFLETKEASIVRGTILSTGVSTQLLAPTSGGTRCYVGA